MICVILGLAVPAGLIKAFETILYDALIYKPASEDQEAYNKWTNPRIYNADDSLVNYRKFYGYNLTNENDVVYNGAQPVFEEIGPYTYRQWDSYENVTFKNDDKDLTFVAVTNYEFDSTKSCSGCSETDTFVNLNPTYITAYEAAGGPTSSGAVFAQSAFTTGMTLIFNAAQYYCANVLGNATYDCYEYHASAQWNSANGNMAGFIPAGTSVTDQTTFMAGVQASLPAVYNFAMELAALGMKFEFGLYSVPSPATTFANDADAQRWIYGTQGASPSNYCLLTNTSVGTSGVGCATTLLATYAASPATAAAMWPIGSAGGAALELAGVAAYLQALGGYSTTAWSKLSGAPIYQQTEGMAWVSRTMNEWFFYYSDPILGISKGQGTPGANSAIFDNMTALENWINGATATGVTSGKDDIENIFQIDEYKGHYKTLPRQRGNDTGYYCGSAAPITGSYGTFIVGPGKAAAFSWETRVTDDVRPDVFVTQIRRKITLSSRGEEDWEGIPAMRFEAAPSEFDTNTEYDMYYTGVFNQSCVKTGGTPAMITLPHLYKTAGLPSEWSVDGISPGNDADHNVVIIIDKVIGTGIKGNKRLQVNFLTKWSYIANATASSSSVGTTTSSKLIPTLWVDQESYMSSKQIDTYKKKILQPLAIIRAILIAFLVIGVFCILAAGIMIFYAKKKDEGGNPTPVPAVSDVHL